MKKILVIEDMPSLREEILETLECLEFEPIGAENGRIGVQLAQLHAPDLIICDIMMPELDGYGVFKSLRENPETASIPFIFLSAKADKTDIRQGMNLGADDYLTKPFTIAELSEAISARLNKQSAITQPYVQEMKRAAEHLKQLAYRDPLTDLPNRILLHQRLQEALGQAKRNQGGLAILCLNLLRFKVINTTLGHMTGDALLQAVAQRLTQLVQPTDTVARLNGDEFSVVLTQVTDQPAVESFVQKLLQVLAQPYHINQQDVQVQFSIGITLVPQDDSPLDQLLNHADVAMRRAKQQGGSQYQFYSQELDTLASQQQLVEAKLSSALRSLAAAGADAPTGFVLHYQPQVNLITKRIIGAEALLRWQEPELGFLYPDTFIPVAESTGLIVSLGEWVLRQACLQAKHWQKNSMFPIRMSVNLSARQFKEQNLLEVVARTLSETDFNPDLLVLELTETSIMENIETTISTLQELKAMGIQVAIDDFGTGYSSLNYLKRFPIDTLKIDQSFVSNISTDPNDAAISTAIIAMAQSLKLKVIAEGVETEDQLAFLRKHGCHGMQGYLFSPAVTATEFESMLLQDRRL